MKQSEEISGSASGLMKTTEDSGPRWLKLMKILEVIILVSILVIVWGIFVVIPIVFYALPPLQANSEQNPGQTSSNNLAGCLEQSIYTGTICTEELRKWQMCFSGQQTNDVYVPSSVDQDEAESMANQLLTVLPILSPRPECVADIKPFMCLRLFGSCDANNQPRQVSQAECERLRDDVCAEPWRRINSVQKGALPDCGTFEDQEIQCLGTNGTLPTNDSDDVTLPSSWTIMCDEGFYLHNESTCRHLCSSWVDPAGIDADTVIIIASLVNAVVSSAIVIIVTLTVLRKDILRFPKYYLIYLCITTVIIVLVVLIGVADKKKLFCSSRSLVESFTSASSYCTLNGIIYHYGVIQIGLWTLFFTFGIFWGIFFPFHYQKFKSANWLKYIHATTVLLSLSLPVISIVVQIKDGYQLSEAPRRAICTGRNVTHTFFGFLFPFSILSAIITTLLVLIFWKILKELTIKKLSRESKPSVVGRAEAKILSVTCYYVLTSCLILITFIYSLVSRDRSKQIITDYLLCQSTGLQAGKECGETPDVQLGVLNSLGTASVFLQSFVPVVVLMFISKCTKSWKWTILSKGGTSPSTRSRSSNTR